VVAFRECQASRRAPGASAARPARAQEPASEDFVKRISSWLVAFALAGLVRVPCAAAAADSLAVAARVRAVQLGLLRADRLQHGSLSFTLAAGAGLAGARRAPAFAGVLGVGVLKELRDRRGSGFDRIDLAADAIGAALGALAAARR
jgi:hypothetical protein